MTATPSFMQDIARGLSGKCPHCRRGKLFRSWLKVADHCNDCHEAYHHHRADDLPAYLVVLILGHIMVGFALELERHFAPPFWWHFAFTLPLAALLGLGMLQPIKGAVVALQWRMGMHGFKNRSGLAD